eukprot:CAMPEP_0170623622 /NCGR_PEP_ID=MMETSP0224-20130122/29796_1 /TAXON_ID=285029 /ORGANISM="Togula jolla, Strain CCCM 725" /LENGTH=332 /DNA_ID=CAMNT_0010950087 /DNA_START=162 /DNA_END=1160 /DNA_ORIENTATION=+
MLDRRLQAASAASLGSERPSQASYSDVAASSVQQQLSSQWSEEMPEAVLFPANKPCSRADAVVLDQWVTRSLAHYAQRSSSSEANEESLSRAVEELVPILSIGLHEIVRQVSQHCLQRGMVLEKLWRTFVELFERALREAKASLKRYRTKTAKLEADLARTREELVQLKQNHPQQLARLHDTLASKFDQRKDDLEEQLTHLEKENQTIRADLKEKRSNVASWFPLFTEYNQSVHATSLAKLGPAPASSKTPEAYLAADYKRILSVLPPEARRRVGFFVSSLLGLRGSNRHGANSVEGLEERKEINQWKIEQLEEQLQQLRTTKGLPSPAPEG